MVKKTNWPATMVLFLGSLVILFPIYLLVVVAFKNPQEMAASIISLPQTLHWENFNQAIAMTNFFRSFKNSFTITVGAVILTLLSNSMVAYAIVRNLQRKFFKFLYYYFISELFIPFPIIM